MSPLAFLDKKTRNLLKIIPCHNTARVVHYMCTQGQRIPQASAGGQINRPPRQETGYRFRGGGRLQKEVKKCHTFCHPAHMTHTYPFAKSQRSRKEKAMPATSSARSCLPCSPLTIWPPLPSLFPTSMLPRSQLQRRSMSII